MDLLEAIKEYFYGYENIDEEGLIYINNTPVENTNYAIIQAPMPNGGIVKSFIGGDVIMQYLFEFDTINQHSNGVDDINKINSLFYVKLEKWIRDNNRNGILPNVENCQSIEVVRSAYVKHISEDGQQAVHSMSARITYYEKGDLKQYDN